VEVLHYAEMFQGIRKQTMVEAQDTVARIVTQTDIFDELKHRRAVLEARKASLHTEYDELLEKEADTQFGGERQLVNTRKQIDKLGKELEQLQAQRATQEVKLMASGDVKVQASIITIQAHLRRRVALPTLLRMWLHRWLMMIHTLITP